MSVANACANRTPRDSCNSFQASAISPIASANGWNFAPVIANPRGRSPAMLVSPMTDSDQYSEAETKRRAAAALKKMLATPPKPFTPKAKKKPSLGKSKVESGRRRKGG